MYLTVSSALPHSIAAATGRTQHANAIRDAARAVQYMKASKKLPLYNTLVVRLSDKHCKLFLHFGFTLTWPVHTVQLSWIFLKFTKTGFVLWFYEFCVKFSKKWILFAKNFRSLVLLYTLGSHWKSISASSKVFQTSSWSRPSLQQQSSWKTDVPSALLFVCCF